MPNRQRHVLLVEDHQADITLTRKAFDAIRYPRTLHVAIDGVEAMAFLRQQGRFSNVSLPDIILLDLNMPRKDGREVLQEIRADARLKLIPVIVLTTSASPQDIRESFQSGANAYVVKPVGFAKFVEVVKAIDTFWFDVSILIGDVK